MKLLFSELKNLYNSYKWDQKIQPLLYQESQKQYVEALERVAVEASGYFFDALAAQQQEAVLLSNVANTDTLYQISKGRYELGKLAENELLQIELNLLNARNSLEQAGLTKGIAYRQLTQFLTLPENASVVYSSRSEILSRKCICRYSNLICSRSY